MFIVHCYNESVQVERPLRAEYLPIDTECLMIDNGVLTINKSWLYNFVQSPYDPSGGGSSGEYIVNDYYLNTSNGYSYSNGANRILIGTNEINQFYDGTYEISVMDNDHNRVFGTTIYWDSNGGGPTKSYPFGENNENSVSFSQQGSDGYDTIDITFDGASGMAWDTGYYLTIQRVNYN